MLAWHLGRSTTWDTHDFMAKLNAATGTDRFQPSTDALNASQDFVERVD
ncbi:MAG TPA: hypothetical protein VHQ90_16065 [Thermoanaerobaculia bacterium]|nr:hypothetical protein [Thermoanaerobaculia bacterium]